MTDTPAPARSIPLEVVADAPPSLVHHYIGYRALVRAKVTAIRAEQAGGFDLDTVAASVAAKPGHSGRRVQ